MPPRRSRRRRAHRAPWRPPDTPRAPPAARALRQPRLRVRETRMTSERCHLLQSNRERTLVVPGGDGHTRPLEPAAQRLPSQVPQLAPDEPNLAGRRRKERLGRDLDDDEVEAACAEVEQRRNRAVVEQRRE